jgi:hypothetical protein
MDVPFEVTRACLGSRVPRITPQGLNLRVTTNWYNGSFLYLSSWSQVFPLQSNQGTVSKRTATAAVLPRPAALASMPVLGPPADRALVPDAHSPTSVAHSLLTRPARSHTGVDVMMRSSASHLTLGK